MHRAPGGYNADQFVADQSRDQTAGRRLVPSLPGSSRQKLESLPLRLAATAAVEPPHLQFKVNPRVATRQITHAVQFTVVPARLDTTATATNRFFERRLSLMTRAFGSPCTVGSGRKPGKQHASHSRRLRPLVLAMQNHGNFQPRA